MVATLITPGTSAMLRHAIGGIFWHTYTRIPRFATPDNTGTTGVDESTNAWGEQNYVPGVSVPLQSCLYQDQGRSVIGPNGLIEVSVPVMLVPLIDPLHEGDSVSNICTLDGIVLLQGPIEVENATDVAPESGGVLYRQVLLRQVKGL